MVKFTKPDLVSFAKVKRTLTEIENQTKTWIRFFEKIHSDQKFNILAATLTFI